MKNTRPVERSPRISIGRWAFQKLWGTIHETI